jgi:hypothetical protein
MLKKVFFLHYKIIINKMVLKCPPSMQVLHNCPKLFFIDACRNQEEIGKQCLTWKHCSTVSSKLFKLFKNIYCLIEYNVGALMLQIITINFRSPENLQHINHEIRQLILIIKIFFPFYRNHTRALSKPLYDLYLFNCLPSGFCNKNNLSKEPFPEICTYFSIKEN